MSKDNNGLLNRSRRSLLFTLIIMLLMNSFINNISENGSSENNNLGPTIENIPMVSYGDVVNSFNGSTPVIDGKFTNEDEWNDTRVTVYDNGVDRIEIRSKHDDTNLYFMILYNIEWLRGIFLEDDGLEPNRKLDPKNEDWKYIGDQVKVEEFSKGYRDGKYTYDHGWPVDSITPNPEGYIHGGARGGMVGSYYATEWWLPLNSGSNEDINITSNETLGLGIGWCDGWPREQLDPYNASTWGTLNVVFSNYPPIIELKNGINREYIKSGEDIEIEIEGDYYFFQYRWDKGLWNDIHTSYVETDGLVEGAHSLDINLLSIENITVTAQFEIIIDDTPPIFNGISELIMLKGGKGCKISWDPASDYSSSVKYNIYISNEDRPFNFHNPTGYSYEAEWILSEFTKGIKYRCIVRAEDPAGNIDNNTIEKNITLPYSLPLFKEIDFSQTPGRLYSDEIFSFKGDPPIVDGNITKEDLWFQTPETIYFCNGEEVSVQSKHDEVDLYLLFQSSDIEALPRRIFFEDDGILPDRELDGQNEDCKIFSIPTKLSEYIDAYWSVEGRLSIQPESDLTLDGGTKYGYNGEKHIIEIWLPLSTKEKFDIDVTKDEILGFGAGWDVGFPSNSLFDRFNPSTWGSLNVIYSSYQDECSIVYPENNEIIGIGNDIIVFINNTQIGVNYYFDDEIRSRLDFPYRITTDHLSPGIHILNVEFILGNGMIIEKEVTFTYDSLPPIPSIIIPQNNEDIDFPISVNVSSDTDTSQVLLEIWHENELLDVYIMEKKVNETQWHYEIDYFEQIEYIFQYSIKLNVIAIDQAQNRNNVSIEVIHTEYFIEYYDDDDDDYWFEEFIKTENNCLSLCVIASIAIFIVIPSILIIVNIRKRKGVKEE